MDDNKRKKLAEIGYRILPCCALCKHGKFKPNNDFGDCTANTYEHLKHSGDARQLSINRLGSCPRFQVDEARLSFLHGFREFLK
jgi:hypothetical protein